MAIHKIVKANCYKQGSERDRVPVNLSPTNPGPGPGPGLSDFESRSRCQSRICWGNPAWLLELSELILRMSGGNFLTKAFYAVTL